MISMANAVNITDGLDGLAGWLLLFNYAVYAYICYSRWLLILAAICLLVVGTLIAFLWYNIKPAQFYMWDVGALALWAGLAVLAMMTNTLVVLLIISAIYILEILSSLIQVLSKKFRNWKKIFRIAPFHHHLEAIGWKEESVVMRFWLIGMVLSTIGLIVNIFLK
jgi:phospho-N-acetylmuramoyl-pentapeptide-transferase